MPFDWKKFFAYGDPQRMAQIEAKEEQQKEQAQRFTKLVSAFDELGWMPKDVAMTRSLADLEGIAQGKTLSAAFGEKEISRRKQELEIAALEREAQAENAFGRAISGAGRESMSIPSPSAPGLMPDIQAQVQQPLNSARLLQAFQENPQAANTTQGRMLLAEALRSQESGDVGGPPQVMEGPFGSKLITDARGRSTPQVVFDPSKRQPGGLGFEQRIALMNHKDLLDTRKAITRAMSDPLLAAQPELIGLFTQQLEAINAKLEGQGGGQGGDGNPKDPLGLFPTQ